MSISRKHLWLMKLARNRLVTDTLCWMLFAFFVFLFCSLHGVFEYEQSLEGYSSKSETPGCLPGDLICMLKSPFVTTLIFTIGIMIPVYFNLVVLKKFILDKKIFGPVKYTLYLTCVVFLAVIFSYCINVLHKNGLLKDIYIVEANLVTIGCIVSLVILISTGLLYLRDVLTYEYQLGKKERELAWSSVKIAKLEKAVSKLEKDHMKVGSEKNYHLISYDEILYFQGDGNEPIIHLTNGDEIRGNRKLMDYEVGLPDLFVRVHKSYIVSAKHIVRRRSSSKKKTAYFVLRGCQTPIPIGATYEENIENNPYLRWNNDNALPQRELRVVSVYHSVSK